MSYSTKFVYTIKPIESYKIIRNCSGCSEKSRYVNTEKFRVNANGKRIDVWLIYQCEKCKHTYNLSVYERKNPKELDEHEYKLFLANSKEMAMKIGTNKALLAKNGAQPDLKSCEYTITNDGEIISERSLLLKGDIVIINNPYCIALRTEKIAAEICGVSRSKMSSMLKSKAMEGLNENNKITLYVNENITGIVLLQNL